MINTYGMGCEVGRMGAYRRALEAVQAPQQAGASAGCVRGVLLCEVVAGQAVALAHVGEVGRSDGEGVGG